MAGCESSTPVEALEEQANGTTSELLTQLSGDSLAAGELQQLMSGPILPPVINDNLRKVLKEHGINPDSLTFTGPPEKGSWFIGKEAWDRLFADQELDTVRVASTPQSISFNSESSNTDTQTAMSGDSTPAYTEFMVTEGFGSPSSGSVTVNYQGQQITTTYTSSDSPFTVASMISHKINDDADFQLSSTVTMTDVRVTEKWPGCEHNGNIVHISATTGTHISINDTEFFMDGGTDDGVGCITDNPLSPPQLLSPPNNSVDQPVSLTLDWEPVEGATSYGVQVAIDAEFTNLVINEAGITSTMGHIEGLAFLTTHYWRVRAFNPTGDTIEEQVSDWSDTWNFTTGEAPPVLTAKSHINTPCCSDFGPVEMGSVSQASVPIQHILVIGESRRDFQTIALMGHELQNASQVATSYTEFKQSYEPESFWQQFGDHEFQDPNYYNGLPVMAESSDHVHF